MKILVLNYEFPPLGGGASTVSYDISREYVKRGYMVDLVTMCYLNLPQFEKKKGINIYRVKCLRTRKDICYPWEQLSYLISAKNFIKKQLIKNEYDICHTHFLVPTGILALWLKKKYKIPYIITAHGSDVPGHNPDRFKILHKFTKPIIKIICKKAKWVITSSECLKKEIINNVGCNNINLVRIPNGININKYKPQKKKKIIFTSGRLHPSKGFQYLIRSIRRISLDYELHICGDGPMMSKLINLAKNSKTKIIFHGWIDNRSKQYKNLIESASIFILVSERENASISLLEGMLSGCAVITSNISGCSETMGSAGLKINPKSVKELKTAIEFLIKDANARLKFGELAIGRVLEQYDNTKIFNKYIKLIDG